MNKENTIEVVWGAKNKTHYVNKGYKFTKLGDKFLANLNDLPHGSTVKINVACDYCGVDYTITYQHYYRTISSSHPKFACKKCKGLKTAECTLDDRKEKHYKAVLDFCESNGYVLKTNKDDICSVDSIVNYECPIHGDNSTKLENILQGYKCYHCGRESAFKKRYANDLHIRQQNLYNNALKACERNNYTLISDINEIKNNTSYVKYKCERHGIKKMRINNLISGKKCPICQTEYLQKLNSLPREEVKSRIESCGGTIENVDDYINNNEKNLKIHCPSCNEIFITSLSHFTQHGGQLCGNCAKKESIGESKIRKYLEEHNISFEQEKWFDDCRDVKPLPFDFYIQDYNIIIEFDGKQHFDESHFFSHTETSTVKYHDQIKNEYCQRKNISLIRIPYWEINQIDKILDEKLV